jgi:DNA-binding HxlR family transcriptional regulator
LKPRHVHRTEDCRAVSDILQRVGDKWTVLVVGKLGEADALQRVAARGRRHLAEDADHDAARLERDGFVTRTVFPTSRRASTTN